MTKLLTKKESMTKIKQTSIILLILIISFAVINIALAGLMGAFIISVNTNENAEQYLAEIFIENIDTVVGIVYKEYLTKKFSGILVMCAVIAVVLIAFSKIFMNIMKSESPFKADYVKYLKRISILLCIGSFLPRITMYIVDGFLVGFGCVNIIPIPSMLFMGIVIYFVYRIFYYGTQLQQESDDTV